MSLADCFAKAGKAISGQDKAAIEALVESGLSEEAAVDQYLAELDGALFEQRAFHGTSEAAFEKFKYQAGLGGSLGYWFASTKEAATRFATPRYAGVDPGVIEVELDIKNPKEYQGYQSFMDDVLSRESDTFEDRAKSLRRSLMRQGHDGVVIRDSDTDLAGVRDDWVAFKPEQVEIISREDITVEQYQANLKKLRSLEQPGDDSPRGFFDPEQFKITLTDTRDLSTFIHEMGHAWLEVLRGVSELDGSIQQDLATLEQWWSDNGATTDRQKHEMFASGFETYWARGEAPTPELQSLFTRFQAWLISVYKRIDQIFASNDLAGTQLPDDVKEVMDRLVASQDAIDAARGEQQYGPLPVEALGLSKEDAAQYQKEWTEQAARDEAKLHAEVMRDLRRQRSEEWRKAVDDRLAQVEAEIAAQPEYIARDALTDPEGPKLDADYVRQFYGTSNARRLNKMTVSGGLNPDLIADQFGYSSGDELMLALLGTRNKSERKSFAKAQAEAQILEERGDLVNDGTLYDEAKKIVSSDRRGDLLVKELNWLNKATGQKPTARQMFKAAAERDLGPIPIYRLRPDLHKRNEVKARNAARRALLEGDLKKAAMEEHRALRQFYLAQESKKLKEQSEKNADFARSLKGKKLERIRQAGDIYIDQLTSLLDQFEFRRVSNKQIRRRASMGDWLASALGDAHEGHPYRNHEVLQDDHRQLIAEAASQDQQGARPDTATIDAMIAESEVVNYKTLTASELQAVTDSIRSIVHLSRLKNRLLTAQDKRSLDEAVTDLTASIQEHSTGDGTGEFGSTRPRSGERRRALAAFKDVAKNPMAILHTLDGFNQNGMAWQLIGRPLQAAAAQETEQLNQANQALQDIFKRYSAKELRGMNRQMFDERLRLNITKHDALSILLNWGNETNRSRVMDGFDITEETALYIMDKYLVEKDYAFVRDVWAYLDTFKEVSFSLHRDMFGFTPEEVKAAPFETKYGTMPGGYYPISYDPERSARAEQHLAAKEGEKFTQGVASRKKLGSTQARVARVMRPMSTDMTQVIFGHVADVIHQTTHNRALFDVGRLLTNDMVKGAITREYGPHLHQQLITMLRTLKDGPEQVIDIQDKVAIALRNNATLAMLGSSLRTIVLQPFGITNSIVKAELAGINVSGLLSGYAKYMKNPAEESRQIREESLYMKNREQTQTVAIRRIKNQVANKGRFDAIRESTMIPIMKTQFYSVDAPLYMAARDYYVGQGMELDQAVELAEQVVRDAQGGGNIVDTASAMQGGPYRKMFTNFLTYMVTTYGLQAENYRRTFKIGDQSVTDFIINTFVLMTMPAILTAMLNDWVAGEDDDEDFVERAVREQASFVLSMNPLTAQVSGAATGFDYTGPQGTALFGKVGQLVQQSEQGEVDEAWLKSAIWVGGLATGLPAAQVNRTVFGVKQAVEEGDDPLTTLKKAGFGPERD